MKADTNYRRHFLLSTLEQNLPFYIESIGRHAHQEPIDRKEGYPYFHWLQTEEGEGEIMLSGERFLLPPNHGFFLFPRVQHAYEARTSKWTTAFITFDGTQAQSVMASLGFHYSTVYRWEEDTPPAHCLVRAIQKIKKDPDFSGLDGSIELYQFLITLKKYGQTNKQTSLSRMYERLRPLLRWLEEEYRDDGINLEQMARIIHLSPQHLNTLFRSTFGISPYSYLIQLRIHKSKELLIMHEHATVKTVANMVGFLDVSHFIATFRKAEGMTPDQFRRLHTSS